MWEGLKGLKSVTRHLLHQQALSFEGGSPKHTPMCLFFFIKANEPTKTNFMLRYRRDYREIGCSGSTIYFLAQLTRWQRAVPTGSLHEMAMRHLVGSFLRHPAGKQRAGPRGELQSRREKQHNSGNHCSEHNSPKPPQILQSTWEADNGTAGGVVEEAGWGLVHYLLSCTHSHSLKIKGCHIHVCGPTLYEDG